MIDGIKSNKAIVATVEEEARIRGIDAVSLPGHEALVEALKKDGITSVPMAAVQILAAEKERSKRGGNLPVIPEKVRGNSNLSKGDGMTVLSERKHDKMGGETKSLKMRWEASADLRREFRYQFEAFKAYEENLQAGRIGHTRQETGPVVKSEDLHLTSEDSIQNARIPKIDAEELRKKWEASKDLQAEFRDNFEAYKAFVEQEADGNARI
ncbi:MAG: hypothetical protein GY928_14050 [Colwellia sp.]|nr:hypothetical protein [Colwellia sp.]